MADLRSRFRKLDDVPTPDLWRDVTSRAAARSGSRDLSAHWRLVLAIALLVVAMAAGAVAVGSGLLPLPPSVDEEPAPVEQPAFGAAAPCPVEHLSSFENALLILRLEDRSVTLGADGHLVIARPPQASLDATYAEQRLTPAGIGRIQDRVRAAGLTPGCRIINGPSIGTASLSLTADGEVTSLQIDPYAMRMATEEEESALDALLSDLQNLDAWMGPSDLVIREPRSLTPTTWLLTIDRLENTEPGEGGTGAAQVELPGGGELGTYGVLVLAEAEGPSSTRCADLTHQEAMQVARSLEAAGAFQIPEHPFWEIGAPGMIQYIVGISPVLPGGGDCEALVADRDAPRPSPSGLPTGDLTGIDACELLPSQWNRFEDPGAGVAFDVDSFACSAEKPSSNFWGDSASVAVRGSSTTLDEARHWAATLFGDGVVEEAVGDRTVWFNACALRKLTCTAAAAVFEPPYFYVVTYESADEAVDASAELRDLVQQAAIDEE